MANSEKDTFGINMKKWCRNHEDWVQTELERRRDPQEILVVHIKKLEWLQHERLVHLIVLFMTVMITLFALAVTLWLPQFALASGPIFLVFLILLCFYIAHYFFLENTVQHWYRIADELRSRK